MLTMLVGSKFLSRILDPFHSKGLAYTYTEFKDRHFVVNARENTFSKTAMDQANEHNNKNN